MSENEWKMGLYVNQPTNKQLTWCPFTTVAATEFIMSNRMQMFLSVKNVIFLIGDSKWQRKNSLSCTPPTVNNLAECCLDLKRSADYSEPAN